jgi:hypothetical protein
MNNENNGNSFPSGNGEPPLPPVDNENNTPPVPSESDNLTIDITKKPVEPTSTEQSPEHSTEQPQPENNGYSMSDVKTFLNSEIPQNESHATFAHDPSAYQNQPQNAPYASQSQDPYANQNTYTDPNQNAYSNTTNYYATYTTVAPQGPPKGLAIASMVLGIVGFLGFCCSYGSTSTLCIVGLILGLISIKNKEGGRGMAITGIILSGLSILSGIVVVVLYLLGAAASIMPYFLFPFSDY